MRAAAEIAAEVLDRLIARGETVATAESLTGGLVCATLVDAPGASKVVRGGVVAYDPEIKSTVLGVGKELIDTNGTVDDDVAREMAEGIRLRLGATWGVSTTGVAGPASSEGKPVGTVFVAIAGPGASSVRELDLSGDRSTIRQSTTAAVLSLLLDTLEEQSAEKTG
ncbi:MAG TPA: nicotinamide-nucleotide amidohydrolase family protein [Aeromicrobium sp.]|nr:nicotinamide-nucleotide amidohydrolase family protein [Aeromicrobium sp.]